MIFNDLKPMLLQHQKKMHLIACPS